MRIIHRRSPEFGREDSVLISGDDNPLVLNRISKYKLNYLEVAIESSASDTCYEYFRSSTPNAGNYGRKFGVQLCDKTGAGVNGETIRFTLVDAPEWLYLNYGLTLKYADVITLSADLNPKHAVTDTRNGVACCQLMFDPAELTTPYSGSYTLRATYGELTRDLLCHYVRPDASAPNHAPLELLITGSAYNPLYGNTTNSEANPLALNTGDTTATTPKDGSYITKLGCTLTATFEAIDGVFAPINGSGGFGMVWGGNVVNTITTTGDAFFGYITFPILQRQGGSKKCKITYTSNDPQNAGVTKTSVIYYIVTGAV